MANLGFQCGAGQGWLLATVTDWRTEPYGMHCGYRATSTGAVLEYRIAPV
jgi:hypothetical protein